MSNLKRLERVVKSWTGKLTRKRKYYYTTENVRLIITDLGIQISPEVFEWLTTNTVAQEEFISQVHESEEVLGIGIVRDFDKIHPELDAKVYEDGQTVMFTLTYKGKERIFAELELPDQLKKAQPEVKEEPKAEENPKEEAKAEKKPEDQPPGEGGGMIDNIPID